LNEQVRFSSQPAWLTSLDAIESYRAQSHNSPIFAQVQTADSYPPRWVIALLIAIFAFYSFEQNQIHAYLATLPSKPPYVLPSDEHFERSVSPHYKAEVVIYALLFGLCSPQAPKFNVSMGLSWALVFTNLWVSGWRTKEWYRVTFGEDKVKNKEIL
jgi:hypothetical protein